jgi:hypothetical protein
MRIAVRREELRTERGRIRMVHYGDETEIFVHLRQAERVADRLAKAGIVFAILYIAFEIFHAFHTGVIQRMVQ